MKRDEYTAKISQMRLTELDEEIARWESKKDFTPFEISMMGLVKRWYHLKKHDSYQVGLLL